MIDLSQFVGNKVRVTLENGQKYEGTFEYCHLVSSASFPYVFWCKGNIPCNINKNHYNKNGVSGFAEAFGNSRNLIQIEEIKPMSKYEELEKQVAEMQKEIDRLKKEEEKNCLNLKPVEITRTVQVTPQEYYEYCKDYDVKPTATGYVKYYSSLAWTMDGGDYTETFKVIEG